MISGSFEVVSARNFAAGFCVAMAWWSAVLPAAWAQGKPGAIGAPQVGEMAADFELRSVTGESVKLSDQLQQSPVVLVVLRGFPGYQCPVCGRQVQELMQHAAAFRKHQARVLLIYPGPAAGLEAKAKEFLHGEALPEPLQMLLDPDEAMVTAWGLRWSAPKETAYPSTFVIEPSGKIRFAKVSASHGGRASAEEILKTLAP